MKFRQGTDGREITVYKSMVGSIALRECDSVDALHCGTNDNVEELGGARAGDLGDELMSHALEV